MRAIRYVDVPITEDRDIPFDLNKKIIGVSILNQGTNDITLAMGSENAHKTLQTGDSVAYGDNHGGNDVFYLVGNLIIKSTSWTTSNVVITYAYDVTDTQQNDC